MICLRRRSHNVRLKGLRQMRPIEAFFSRVIRLLPCCYIWMDARCSCPAFVGADDVGEGDVVTGVSLVVPVVIVICQIGPCLPYPVCPRPALMSAILCDMVSLRLANLLNFTSFCVRFLLKIRIITTARLVCSVKVVRTVKSDALLYGPLAMNT